MVKISIVIPVFNEQDCLLILSKKLNEVMNKLNSSFEIIYINDGSTDQSAQILDRISRNDKNIKVMHLIRNYGQTQAIAAGVDNAQGEIIVIIDADLQNDPEDIPGILEKLDQGYDVVSGWRINRKDGFILRVLPSRLANMFFSAITKVKLHDLGCSLKAYRREILERIEFFGEIHRFLPICAAMYGAKICEIPVKHHKRSKGKSKYGITRIFNVLLDMLTLMFMWKFTGKPVYVFGGMAMSCFAVSGLLGVFVIMRKIFLGGVWVSPLLFLSIMVFIIGMQFFLMGIMAELIVRLYYGNQEKKRYRLKAVKKKD